MLTDLLASEVETVLRSMQFADMRVSLDAFIDLFTATVPMSVVAVACELTDAEFRRAIESTYIRVVYA